MKILVSGATGFIGKNLISELLKKKIDVYVIVRPSTNTSDLPKEIKIFVYADNELQKLISYIKNENIDGVVHLASLFLAQHTSTQVKHLIDSNVLFSTELLDASVSGGVKWFINTGTVWQHYKNKTYSPVNLYAATKQAFEMIAQYYCETSAIQFVTIKLNDTFGPGDTRPKIINLWNKIATSGEALSMSKGEQCVNFTYIDDVIAGFLQMIKLLSKNETKNFSGKSFTISSPSTLSLKDLAKLFEKVSKKKLNIIWGGREYRAREVMKPWSKGIPVPGWESKTSLQEGIAKTLEKLS